MERSEIRHEANLPGYDALRWARHLSSHTDVDTIIAPDQALRYEGHLTHRIYLENLIFDAYNKLPKVFDKGENASVLSDYAEQLSQESLPRFLDAAGWAYAESALTSVDSSTLDRMKMINAAENTWQRGLGNHLALEQSEHFERFKDDSFPFRTALNLAFIPLMRAIVLGNVSDQVREQTFADTLSIGQIVAVQRNLAIRDNDHFASQDFVGLQHEINALLSMLYINDPRYIPLPSSSKADSGYYHPDQTHDLIVINQHWGKIKKVIPVEIKAHADLSRRKRFKALLIRGKMHLMPDGERDPYQTLQAFADVFDHSTDINSQKVVEDVSMTVQTLLRLYQQGVTTDLIALSGIETVTKFHDSAHVTAQYPELSKEEGFEKKAKRAA